MGRRAMDVYERAVRKVPLEHKLDVYEAGSVHVSSTCRPRVTRVFVHSFVYSLDWQAQLWCTRVLSYTRSDGRTFACERIEIVTSYGGFNCGL